MLLGPHEDGIKVIFNVDFTWFNSQTGPSVAGEGGVTDTCDVPGSFLRHGQNQWVENVWGWLCRLPAALWGLGLPWGLGGLHPHPRAACEVPPAAARCFAQQGARADTGNEH